MFTCLVLKAKHPCTHKHTHTYTHTPTNTECVDIIEKERKKQKKRRRSSCFERSDQLYSTRWELPVQLENT